MNENGAKESEDKGECEQNQGKQPLPFPLQRFFLLKKKKWENVCMPGYNQGGKFDDIVNQVLINLTQKESTSPNCKNEVLPQSLTKKKKELKF